MAKLVSFVICDSINNIPATPVGMVPSLVAPQIAIRPQFIPGNFSFGIAIGISGIDLQTVNKMRFTITDPKGTIIQDSGDSELPVVPAKDSMPDEYQGFMMCMDIRNLVIASEGEFLFSFYVNEELIGQQIIPVFRRSPTC